MTDDLELDATKRVQARLGFLVHLAMYLIANLGFIVIWSVTGRGYPWFMWPALGWGIGVAAHAIGMLLGPGSDVERKAIDKELRRLRIAPR
ncbi:MAG: 2TM domain-containing protein [Myxococcales bacterium]|nr:2TM domain-containing protein [Myxococcales bacterium]